MKAWQPPYRRSQECLLPVQTVGQTQRGPLLSTSHNSQRRHRRNTWGTDHRDTARLLRPCRCPALEEITSWIIPGQIGVPGVHYGPMHLQTPWREDRQASRCHSHRGRWLVHHWTSWTSPENGRELQKTYQFGKYVELQKEEEGAAFNGRRIKQLATGEFQIDMEKFIKERLHEVNLEKGRKSDRKAKATEEEISAARATCGALNSLSKEGRPDAAGPSSLMASRLSSLTVEDILELNQVVKSLKESAEIQVRIQLCEPCVWVPSPTRPLRYRWTDHRRAREHLVRRSSSEDQHTVILVWRSGKLQRVVNSTLAAETQSLSRGLGDLAWVMLLMKECTDGKFNIRSWREHVAKEEMMILGSEHTDEYLKESLAVVDAKSLFDHLSKETVGGSEKRTAIDIQIIRQDLYTWWTEGWNSVDWTFCHAGRWFSQNSWQ